MPSGSDLDRQGRSSAQSLKMVLAELKRGPA
ncbi:unnamed protein product, partial [Allacma fusca]